MCSRWLVNGTEVPLGLDLRYTLVAGSLVISSPESVRDTGSYQCLAINRCGTIVSKAASVKFGCEWDNILAGSFFLPLCSLHLLCSLCRSERLPYR